MFAYETGYAHLKNNANKGWCSRGHEFRAGVITANKVIYCCVLFDYAGNSIDETVHWEHLNQYINIYLHRECPKTSFICCFIVTTKNLI